MLKSLTYLITGLTFVDFVSTYSGTNNINITILDEYIMGGITFNKYQLALINFNQGYTYRFNSSMLWCRDTGFERWSQSKLNMARTLIYAFPKNFSNFAVTVEFKANRHDRYSIYGEVKGYQMMNKDQCEKEKLSVNGTYLSRKEMNITWAYGHFDNYHVLLRNSSGATVEHDIISDNFYHVDEIGVATSIVIIPYKDGYPFYHLGVSISEINEFNNVYSFVDSSSYAGKYDITFYRIKKIGNLSESFIFTIFSGKEFTISLEEKKKYFVKVCQRDYPMSMIAFKIFRKVSLKPISGFRIALTRNFQWNITFDNPEYHKLLDYYKMDLRNQLSHYAIEKLLSTNVYTMNQPSNKDRTVYFVQIIPMRNNIALLNLASGVKTVHQTCINGTQYLDVIGEYTTSIPASCHSNLAI